MKKQLFYLCVAMLVALPGCVAADSTVRDGQYTVGVTLSGGTGRATVASPAEVTVVNGQASATIVWSSPNYDAMTVDGITYKPINTEGNSTFKIPVTLDKDIAITAETTAMSKPHQIDYTLHFDSATLKSGGNSNSRVLIIGAVAAVLLSALALVLLHRERQNSTRTSA